MPLSVFLQIIINFQVTVGPNEDYVWKFQEVRNSTQSDPNLTISTRSDPNFTISTQSDPNFSISNESDPNFRVPQLPMEDISNTRSELVTKTTPINDVTQP